MWNVFLWLFSMKKTLMRNFKGLLAVSFHQSEVLSGQALLSICTSAQRPLPTFPSTRPPPPAQTLVGAALADGGQTFPICQQLEPRGPEDSGRPPLVTWRHVRTCSFSGLWPWLLTATSPLPHIDRQTDAAWWRPSAESCFNLCFSN